MRARHSRFICPWTEILQHRNTRKQERGTPDWVSLGNCRIAVLSSSYVRRFHTWLLNKAYTHINFLFLSSSRILSFESGSWTEFLPKWHHICLMNKRRAKGEDEVPVSNRTEDSATGHYAYRTDISTDKASTYHRAKKSCGDPAFLVVRFLQLRRADRFFPIPQLSNDHVIKTVASASRITNNWQRSEQPTE